MTYKKKLIEVALPLEDINREAAREKSIRHGHPSTLHLWWARRPLAACRAVLFASLVDDPSECVAELMADAAKRRAAEKVLAAQRKAWEARKAVFDNAAASGLPASSNPPPGPEPRLEDILVETERERLFEIIRELVKWENSNDDRTLKKARAEILRSTGGNPPPVYDPFCGGGSIPLEAQRLGLEAHASDLNPVPVLINKALIEIPPRFAGKPPVNPGSAGIFAGERPVHKGWHSRGYLPHLDKPGLVQSITFRLHDSVPEKLVEDWKAELEWLANLPSTDPREVELRKRVAKYEDAGHGECWLRDPCIAELVENALLHFDTQRYRLIAWCVMPNHVHALIETFEGHPLDKVIHSWKSFTASEANKILNRSGTFWFRDYHDRFIRDQNHFDRAIEYIEQNPVKAGLVKEAKDWKFSSAGKRHANSPAGMPAVPGTWKGAAGLAEDIRYYGQWMRDEAEKRIGHLYPKVKLPKEHGGGEATVIAWLWARTVASPNPAAKGAHVPLVRSFWLSTKAGKKAWVEPVVDQNTMTYRFEVRTGTGGPRAGTVTRNGGVCLLTGSPIPLEYVRAEGKAGRIGARLMAIVAEGPRSRIYLQPNEEHDRIAQRAEPHDVPDTDLPEQALGFRVQNYGMTKHCHLFTSRQLVALTTFCELVGEARAKALADSGGNQAYADALATYLAFSVSKVADRNSTIATWAPNREHARNTFTRQAISMTWDFAESNALSESSGNFFGGIETIEFILEALVPGPSGEVRQLSATNLEKRGVTFSTDPPYYDNVPYADLSDFLYAWLRRCLLPVHPHLLGTVLVPKAEELVAEPFRHGGKEEARLFFERGMGQVFERMNGLSDPRFPTTIYYAFKQAEDDQEDDEDDNEASTARASTGWETFLQGLIDTGWQVDGTWPMRTELGRRMRNFQSNALASSIVLVCRPRPKDAGVASRRDLLAALKRELPEALRNLQKGNIAPVDLAQAAIGPGMAVFSRYARVLETDGSPMGVRTALALINQSLDEVLAEQEGEFDADTRWALAWFDQYGFTEGAYGQAETLSTAKNTSVSGMVEAGILAAKGGKVRLLKKEELPPDWDPASDTRLTIWEATHQLIRSLDRGEQAAAGLLRKLGPISETARDLSYRLYTVCERRKWAQEAIGYNALVLAWPDLTRLAQEQKAAGPNQGELL